MEHWPLQNAKARFSELVRNAQNAPQEITVRGEPTAVLISKELFERLTKPKPSFYTFMQQSPFKDFELELDRDSTPYTPEIDL